MNNDIKISIRAYAKELHVDESAIRSAIEAGKIKNGVVYVQRVINGKKKKVPKIIAKIATKEWGFTHLNPKPQRGLSAKKVADKLEQKKESIILSNPEEKNDSEDKEYTYTELIKEIKITPGLSYQQALLRKEILATAREKMELEEMQGILVRKSDVEKALFAMGDQLKKSLLNIPARCIDEIIAAPNKIEANNILTLEINQVLTSMSQLYSS